MLPSVSCNGPETCLRQQNLRNWNRRCSAIPVPLQEAVPLFCRVAVVAAPAERYRPLSLSPQRQKQRIQEMLVARPLEERSGASAGGVWAIPDWADPSTLELLGLSLTRPLWRRW